MRYFFLGALFISTFSFAQRPVFTYEPAYVGPLKSYTITDDRSKDLYLVFAQPDCIERMQVNSSGKQKLLHQGILPNPSFAKNRSIESKMLSLFYDNTYIFCYRSNSKLLEVVQLKHADDLVVVETDINTGISKISDTIKLARKEDLVLSYNLNDRLHLVEKPKKKPFYLFHSKAYGESFKTDTVSLLAGNNTSQEFDDTQEETVQILQNNLWLPVHTVNFRNKAFVQNDRFYVVLNSDDLTTWVAGIDLHTLRCTIRKFDRHLSGLNIEGASSNTGLVIDSFLITGISNKNAIHYAVYNILSGELLYKQTIDENNFEKNSTTGIMKVGDYWSRSNVSQVSLTELVDKAKANQLIIEGYKENDVLYLTFGSTYKRFLSATFLGNMLTLGMGEFAQVKPPATVYFHTALNTASFTHSSSLIKTGAWDKMFQHLFANRNTHNLLNLFNTNGFYYMGYYNGIKNEYELYRFAEKME